jgi:hypothetical protein
MLGIISSSTGKVVPWPWAPREVERPARQRADDLRARITAMPASEAARLWRKLITGLGE